MDGGLGNLGRILWWWGLGSTEKLEVVAGCRVAVGCVVGHNKRLDCVVVNIVEK